MIKVARAFSKSPDEIRKWKIRDFRTAQDELLEWPPVEVLVKSGFFSKGKNGPGEGGMTLDELRKKLVPGPQDADGQ